MVSGAELVERESAAYDRWWARLGATRPDAERVDGWTVKDVVAHVSAWKRYSTDRIRAIARGERDPGPPADQDAFNEEARSVAGPWEEVREEALATHRALLDMVASLPEQQIAADDGLVEFIVRVNGSEHYGEHPSSDFAR